MQRLTNETPEAASNIIAAFQARAKFPLSASIELTRRCNLRCRHCYIDTDGHPGLPGETVRPVLDDLAAAGTLFLVLTGGELTVRQDWLDIVTHARRKNFVVTIKTNAVLLRQEAIKRLAELAVLSVHVTLFSARAQDHDHITGVVGSHARALRAIDRLRRHDIAVTVTTPVTVISHDALAETIELVRRLGCNHTVDPRISAAVHGNDQNDALQLNEILMNETVDLLHREGFPLPQPSEDKEGITEPWPCISHAGLVHLSADGTILPCPILPVSFGSVLDLSISEAWQTSTARQELLQQAKTAPTDCRRCRHAWACQHCPAHAWLQHGHLSEPASLDCRFAQARAQTVGRGLQPCHAHHCGEHTLHGVRPEVEVVRSSK
jgi:radical SAM protein with 4Fe4S-binding SPASM domain